MTTDPADPAMRGREDGGMGLGSQSKSLIFDVTRCNFGGVRCSEIRFPLELCLDLAGGAHSALPDLQTALRA